MVPTAPGHLASDGPARALMRVHGDGGGEQRGRDELPAAGHLPLAERGDDAVGAEHPREDVRDREAVTQRRAVRRARDAHQPGLALDDLVEPGPVPVRPALAEARDREHDERRVLLHQIVDRESEPREHTWPEVLHQHVGLRHERAEPGDVLAVLQIEGDRALRAVDRQEVDGLGVLPFTGERWPPAARVVARARLLDLDDLCAGVGEHHGRVRPCEGTGEVEDPDPCERPGDRPLGRCCVEDRPRIVRHRVSSFPCRRSRVGQSASTRSHSGNGRPSGSRRAKPGPRSKNLAGPRSLAIRSRSATVPGPSGTASSSGPSSTTP